MKNKKLTLLALAAALGLAGAANAAVEYDFGDKGLLFDNQTSVSGISLLDPITGLTTEMTVSSTGGDLNSNAGDFGVGDDIIDGLIESITLTFSTDIEFISIDLGLVGADAADGAALTIGASSIDLFTGVSGFNGTSDVYTPSSPIFLAFGDAITLTGTSATSSFDLEKINISVVPEPSAYALLAGLLGLTWVALRRRAA